MQIGFAFIAIALLVMFWGNKRRLLRAKRLTADLNNLRQGATEPASWANDAAHMEQFMRDRKSTRLNSSHVSISYAVFCFKKNNKTIVRSYELSTTTYTDLYNITKQ